MIERHRPDLGVKQSGRASYRSAIMRIYEFAIDRQMLAISQALMCGPKLLMVDELSLGLAPHLIKDLMERLRQLRHKLRISILLIEQDASAALAIADYGYIMEGGRIVYEGSSDKLRSHKDVQEFYLGSGDAARESYRDVKQYRRSRRWWG